MANENFEEKIEVGFEVFAADGQKAIGTVREVSLRHPGEIVVYFENAGDRRVPTTAIAAVHSEKVILDIKKLDKGTREAIKHLHDVEDPRI